MPGTVTSLPGGLRLAALTADDEDRNFLGLCNIFKLGLRGAGIFNRIVNGLNFIQGTFVLQTFGEDRFYFLKGGLLFRERFSSLLVRP